MTLNEFKAWLDGFEAAMGDAPTPEQWAKIKAKLADVQPLAVPAAPLPSPTYPATFWDGPSVSPTLLPYVTCHNSGATQ